MRVDSDVLSSDQIEGDLFSGEEGCERVFSWKVLEEVARSEF